MQTEFGNRNAILLKASIFPKGIKVSSVENVNKTMKLAWQKFGERDANVDDLLWQSLNIYGKKLLRS